MTTRPRRQRQLLRIVSWDKHQIHRKLSPSHPSVADSMAMLIMQLSIVCISSLVLLRLLSICLAQSNRIALSCIPNIHRIKLRRRLLTVSISICYSFTASATDCCWLLQMTRIPMMHRSDPLCCSWCTNQRSYCRCRCCHHQLHGCWVAVVRCRRLSPNITDSDLNTIQQQNQPWRRN